MKKTYDEKKKIDNLAVKYVRLNEKHKDCPRSEEYPAEEYRCGICGTRMRVSRNGYGPIDITDPYEPATWYDYFFCPHYVGFVRHRDLSEVDKLAKKQFVGDGQLAETIIYKVG